MSLPSLRLKANAERRIRAGHLWVFSNEVDTAQTPLTAFEAGQQAQQRTLATAGAPQQCRPATGFQTRGNIAEQRVAGIGQHEAARMAHTVALEPDVHDDALNACRKELRVIEADRARVRRDHSPLNRAYAARWGAGK
mgnify:CR=1 FL=1